MILPADFENKIGFDRIRELIAQNCKSQPAKNLAKEIKFSSDKNWVKNSIDIIEECKYIIQFEDSFYLNEFIDVSSAFKTAGLEGTFLEAEVFLSIRDSQKSIKRLKRFFSAKKDEEVKFPLLNNFSANVIWLDFVIDAVDRIFDNKGIIKDGASSELKSIRGEISDKKGLVSKRINAILRESVKSGYSEEGAGVAVRNGRLVIPVISSNKRMIKGYVHDESSTGKTFFIEPQEIVEINNLIIELEYSERREIFKILTELTSDIRVYFEEIKTGFKYLAELDLIYAKAMLSIKLKCFRPILSESPKVFLIDAIHPLLFLNFKKENKKVVPLNIEINKEKRIFLISGPNAGGKSVCLKTVGLIQYMFQCGLHIPANANSELGLFDRVFLDIGDDQSLDNDLSTYSSHLAKMKEFNKYSNEFSLILIDEFGSGTEPTLGGAIAEALIEKFLQKGAFGVITTHYSNLKHFANNNDGIVNGAMLYDSNAMNPLYILREGAPGSSFAFEIAKKIGLPEEVLERAANIVGSDHINFEKSLKDIARDKKYWEDKRLNVKKLEKKLDSLAEKYSKDLEDVNNSKKQILANAKKEASELTKNVNKIIENTIRQIKEANADSEKTKNLRKELEEKLSQIGSEKHDKIEKLKEIADRRLNKRKKFNSELTLNNQPPESKDFNLEVGAKVKLKLNGALGEIVEIKGKRISVRIGEMLTVTSVDGIEGVSSKEYKRVYSGVKASNNVVSTERVIKFNPEIDLRGKRADEAIKQVQSFIDDAVVVNSSKLKILHGKGDGILRKLIRDYLKTEPVVERFQDEKEELGGAGITLVFLDI